jgi:hypothetical protein
VKGKIALAVDHEPGEFDPRSKFDGLVRAESASQIRKALAAQQKGAIAMIIVDDVHNHPGPMNFEAAYKGYWPDTPPRVERWTPRRPITCRIWPWPRLTTSEKSSTRSGMPRSEPSL